MSWFRSNPLPPEPATLEEKFSIPYLRSLHGRLLENKVITAHNQAMVVETLRILSEMVVYGDNNYELLFDFFCEKNMLALFLEIMRPKDVPHPVLIQILQTMGILCQCVKNDTSLYYILSNNYINEFLMYPYEFDNDELLDQFVSFLKTLSLRMNEQTIQFFYIEKTQTLPLLTRSIELLRFREGMVRIAAQNCILNIYRVKDDRAKAISMRPDVMHSLFSQICIILEAHHSSAVMCSLEYSANLAHASAQDKAAIKASKRIEDQLSDITTSLEDWLYYLQDLIDLKIEGLHTSFVQYFVSNYVYQILLDPILRFIQDIRSATPPQSTSPRKVVKSAKDSEEMLIFSIAVSLYFINQILTTISDTLIKRAVINALFHPLSRKRRKQLLAKDENPEIASESEMGTTEDLDSTSSSISASPAIHLSGSLHQLPIQDRNVYRDGILKILNTNFGSGLGNRLPLLATLVIQNVIRGDFCIARKSSSMGLETDSLSSRRSRLLVTLFQALGITPKLKSELVPTVSDLAESVEGILIADETKEADALVTDCTCREDSEVGRTDPDLLSLRRLLNLSSELPIISAVHIVGIDSENCPLVHTLCSVLMEPAKASLVTLQCTTSCLYNIFCLLEDFRCKEETSPRKPIMSFDDAPESCQFMISSARSAVKIIVDNILKRLLTSTGDIALSLFQEELRRSLGTKWASVFPRMKKDSVLLLPPVSSVTLKIGLEFGMPISQVEATRREIQTFLLMRSFFKQMHKVLTDGGSTTFEDDICIGMVDETLIRFTENGCINDEYRELNIVSVVERLMFPIVISSGSPSEPTVHFTTPERPGGYWTSPMSSSVESSTSSGVVQGQVSVFVDNSEKWKENMRILLDDYALLLISIDDSTGVSGTVRLVAPIHQTDVSISTEKRNILKVLVRSTETIPLMERIGTTSENVIGSPDGPRAGSSPSTTTMRNGINLLQPRQQNVLWRLSIWFENESDCECVSQHIELRRLQVRHEKLNKLKSLLESWSDLSNFYPEDNII